MTQEKWLLANNQFTLPIHLIAPEPLDPYLAEVEIKLDEPSSFLTLEEAQIYTLKQKLMRKNEIITELEAKVELLNTNLKKVNSRLNYNRERSQQKNSVIEDMRGLVDELLGAMSEFNTVSLKVLNRRRAKC